MPLTEDVMSDVVRRYRREVDCHLKLAKFVAERCEKDIVRANTIRATVTYRTKAPDKLRSKLEKYKDEPDLNTPEDVFARIGDLAGVRISTYQERDREKVVAEIGQLFNGAAGGAVAPDKKDQPNRYYRATHCQVWLKPDDLEDDRDNLEGLSCEIQVCSLLAHVWNEVEHDIVYKPTTGAPSEAEHEALRLLGNLTVSGDMVVKLLFDAQSDRLAKAADEAAEFKDVYDFVARIRRYFPACEDFGNHAGQLFEDLTALGLNTPQAIRAALLTDDFVERSAALIQELTDYLDEDPTVALEPRSSDPMLMLLLDVRLNDVLARHPMGRGRGRPPRIGSIAARFRDMRQPTADHNPAL